MLQLDPVTQAALEAATTPTARAQAVLSSISGTITVTVYDGAGTVKGSGTMASLGTLSANVIVLGTSSDFAVSETGSPDPATWTIEFKNAASPVKWMKGTFGLASSPTAEFKWSLATWTNGQAGTISNAYATVRKNEILTDTTDTFNVSAATTNTPPSWTTNFPSALTLAAGANYTFSSFASDPDGDTLTFAKVSGSGSITSAGVYTAGTSNTTLILSITDGKSTTVNSPSCTITVGSVSETYPWPIRDGGPSWPHGTLNLYTGNGTNDGLLTTWRTWIGHQPDILAVYANCHTWTEFRNPALSGSLTSYLYPVIKSVPSTTPILICLSMYPDQEPTVATGGYNNNGLNRYGGTKRLLGNDPWGAQQWNNFRYGYYDDHYRQMALALKAICAGSRGVGSDGLQRRADSFIIRLGWEMNGDWYAWSILNNVAAFKEAWARVVGVVRQEIPGMWFDFSPSDIPVRGTSPAVYIEGYTPDPSSFNVLSMSHHDRATRSGDSTSTVTRTVPSTWTSGHLPGLDRFLNHAKSLGKKMALTEWAAQMENSDATYHVKSQDPEWFYMKTWEWLYANRAYIAWDTHFSPSSTQLCSTIATVDPNQGNITVPRNQTLAAQYFKLKWGGQ